MVIVDGHMVTPRGGHMAPSRCDHVVAGLRCRRRPSAALPWRVRARRMVVSAAAWQRRLKNYWLRPKGVEAFATLIGLLL